MDPAALLSAWEEGAACSAPYRALLLLAATCPERALEEWAQLPVGRRDASLLNLRERIFGGRLEMVANCPRCREAVEVEMNVADLRVSAPPAKPTYELEKDGVRVRFRLPTSADLLFVAQGYGPEALVARCVEETTANGKPLAPGDLPPAVLAALDAEMEAADPQAVVEVVLNCPSCANVWNVRFDIVASLWSEVEGWAARLLHDIHLLASAYGWTERDVLALSPTRRRLYREMVAG